MSGQVEEGNHERNKHDGKKEGIERSHFGDPISNNYARFLLQCFGAIIYEWRFNQIRVVKTQRLGVSASRST
jgi:hypothetical protein